MIRRIAIAAITATVLAAQDTTAQQKQAPPRHVLLNLEDEWARGLVRRDTSVFRRLLAPRFVYTEDSVMVNAEDVIKGVVGSDRVESANNEGMVVHDYGTTAVVTGWLNVRGKTKDGKPFYHRYRFTDTWMRVRGLRWKVIAAQDYLIPK